MKNNIWDDTKDIKDDIRKLRIWTTVAVVAGAAMLIVGWMLGNANHDIDVRIAEHNFDVEHPTDE